MARTVKQWQKEMRAIFEGEGATSVHFTPAGGTHQHAIGTFPHNGKELVVSIHASVSPSDFRAGHNLRTALRYKLREKREKES